jgi:hypothetical protein
VLLGLSIIGTILWTSNSWADNGGNWDTKPDGTGGECNPIKPPGQCFWPFDSTGWSPELRKNENCQSISFRLFRPVGTEAPTVDLYICHDSTTANCEQLEATNLRTGSYEDIGLDSTDWSARGATSPKIRANVTDDDTCDDCVLITWCSN